VLDAEVVEPGAEIVAAPAAPPPSLFRTDDPVEVLKKAKTIADALAPVVREAGMVKNINGKDFLRVEAWQTLGQQLGVTGVIVSTRKLTDPAGWEARCEARTLDGRVIGAADSMCLRNEERWKDAEEFEIRSMAQTRAMSRALASVLRFVPTLAGMGGTPAEEMDRVAAQQGGGGNAGSGPRKPSSRQLAFFERLCKEHGFTESTDPKLGQVMAYAKANLTGGKGGSISKLIDELKGSGEEQTKRADDLGRTVREWAAKQSDLPEPDTEGMEPESYPEDEDIPF